MILLKKRACSPGREAWWLSPCPVYWMRASAIFSERMVLSGEMSAGRTMPETRRISFSLLISTSLLPSIRRLPLS